MGLLEIVGFVFLAVGAITTLVGGLLFLVAGFRESSATGCGMMVPLIGTFVQLYFIFSSWDEAKKPLLIQVVGMVLAVLGGQIAGVNVLDSDIDSDMSGYYEEYYEDESDADEVDFSSSSSGAVSGQSQGDEWSADEESSGELADTFGGDTSPSSTSRERSTPQRLVRQDRKASSRERESSAPQRVVGAVSIETLDQHIGRQITITKTSGKSVRGKLIRVTADSVTVEKRLGGGKMAFPISKEDIDTAVLGR